MYQTAAPPRFTLTAARRPERTVKKEKNSDTKQWPNNNLGFGSKRKDQLWQCVEGCGAKGPSFPSPEEIFNNPSDIELYKGMIGVDGWCVHYEKNTRKCSIYADRPYFCRVESSVFERLYGVKENRFNKTACSFCRDTIKGVYGSHSKELENFNKAVLSSESV